MNNRLVGANTYLERFLELNGGRERWNPDDELPLDGRATRQRLVRRFAWAIPNEPALEAFVRIGNPLVEIGAGNGYWAMLLRRRGLDVVAYDINPPASKWTEVTRGGARSAARYPDRTLFLCWPPYDTPLAFNALRAYQKAGGSQLVYVGEPRRGCNGTDAFFNKLESAWIIRDKIELPQWWRIYDEMTVWVCR